MENCFETITAPTSTEGFEIHTVPTTVETQARISGIMSSLLPALVVISAVIFVFILCGNLLTIIAVRTYRRLRSIISNLFILSLAVSDFIVGFSLPYHMCFYLNDNFGRVQILCLVRFFLVICSCTISILTLIAIALDRYIAILYAIHYKRYMTRRRACYIMLCIWIVGIFVAVIPMFWNNWAHAHICVFNEVLPKGYIVGIIAPGFLMIWLIMFFMYYRISRVAAKQRRLCLHRRSEWKSVQIVLFVMGCFSFCWLPFLVIALFNMYRFMSSELVYVLAFMLAMLNSGINPLIYAWKNSNFRTAFSELLCCKNNNSSLHQSSAHSHHSEEHAAHKPRLSSVFTVPMHAFAMIIEAERSKKRATNETQIKPDRIINLPTDFR